MAEQLAMRMVSISYFDPFALFESVRDEFKRIFPLENVHWKSASGSIRTVNRLPVTLFAETDSNEEVLNGGKPFVRLIIVTCQSVSEYRSKVRPLLKQWLPEVEPYKDSEGVILPCRPVILLYANSEVVDSNIFKTTSIMEKLTKDFPDTDKMELKSVYKSPREKEEFWNQLSQHFKTYLLDILKRRLILLEDKLSTYTNVKQARERLKIKEELLHLFLEFRLYDEGLSELEEVQKEIGLLKYNKLENGELEVPFKFELDSGFTLSNSIDTKTLTKFDYYKYFLARKLDLYVFEEENASKYFKVYSSVKTFLKMIDINFKNNPKVLEFKCSFIDAILGLITIEKLKEIPILSELKAEFLLIRRDCWLDGILTTTNFKLIGKNYHHDSDIMFDFPELKKTFIDENTFHEHYMKYNTELLSLYSNCEGKRQRIVDILSIEIGLLHYQRKEYEQAVTLFLSCYEYYIESNWNAIGLNILQIFIDSLANCPDMTVLDIESSEVPVSTVLSNAFLNILKLSKDRTNKEKWWRRFLDTEIHEENSLAYPIEGLFDIKIHSCVTLSRANVLQIPLDITNYGLPEDVKADSIKLLMQNSSEKYITFEASNLTLLQKDNKIVLETKEVVYGDFLPTNLEINIGNTTFIKEYDNNMNSLEYINIRPIYSVDNVYLSVTQSKLLHLGQYGMDIHIKNSANITSFNGTIKILPDVPGMIPAVSFEESSVLLQISIQDDNIKPFIPYYLQSPITSFKLQVDFEFFKENEESHTQEKYSESRISYIECYLPVSVSVEDIFKRNAFFFKFLFNSSVISEPIILYGSKLTALTEDNKYKISGNFTPETAVLVTACSNDSCLNCYQLTTSSGFHSSDMFHLSIRYNTLNEQLNLLVTEAILVQGDVEWYKEFEQWKIFWEEEIISSLRYNYELFDERRIIMLETEIGSNIKKTFKLLKSLTIQPEVIEKMIKCLNVLVKGYQITDIDINAYTKNLISRELIVPVELPDFDQFFYVEFNRINDIEPKISTVMTFNVKIENIGKQWEETKNSGDVYIFEIKSSNDWFVHNKKKFTLPSNNHSFIISLIPLKKGYLQLPHIEITNGDGEPSRVDYVNAYDTILVF